MICEFKPSVEMLINAMIFFVVLQDTGIDPLAGCSKPFKNKMKLSLSGSKNSNLYDKGSTSAKPLDNGNSSLAGACSN